MLLLTPICATSVRWIVHRLECATAPLVAPLIQRNINEIWIKCSKRIRFFLEFSVKQMHIMIRENEPNRQKNSFHLTVTSHVWSRWCLICSPCFAADPGPGLFHDDVLSVSESRNLLRLEVDRGAPQHTWIVSHQRGTNIDLPSSSCPSPHRLFFPTLVLSVTFPLRCHSSQFFC